MPAISVDVGSNVPRERNRTSESMKTFYWILLLTFSTIAHAKDTKYLERETTLHLLDKDKLQSRISEAPPAWMIKQIKEDFGGFTNSGISKRRVDKTFEKIQKSYTSPYIVRYRVIKNQLYRYFPTKQPIATKDNSTEKALKTLLHLFPFSDMDFIFSYLDGVPIKNMPPDFYITEDENDQAPLLFSAKVKDTPYIILIPDWRSTSEWWAGDIKTMRFIRGQHPWNKKKEIAFWKGGLTKPIRQELCSLALEYPDYIIAKTHDKAKSP